MADLQRRVSLIFEADTNKAKASINELVSSLRNISASPTDVVNLANIQQATRAAMELEHHIQRAVNVDTGKLDLGRFTTSLERSGTNLQQYLTTLNKIGPAGNQTFKGLATAINNASTSTARLSKGMANFMTTMKNTVKWQISSSIMHGMISSVQQAYGYAQSLDKTLNNIRIVSGHSAAEMSRFAESANRAAQQLRTTTDQYAKASLIFYQQGLGDAEIEKRTAAVIKMANVTGEAVKDVSSYMTAIWNNFDEGGRSLESFADVMTALGAATASSSAEIAGGLEKFVAIGEQIGLSFDYAATALATITAQTRQSEDVVGNALKTIFARIQGLNLGETLDDGTTLNKYSEALAKVGINIKDTSGQIKDMDVILNEMGSKWQTFGKDTQIALAQAVAGVRQYNQVMSLMNDWDVFKHNLDIAKNSKGNLDKQANIYAESWEASTKQVKNALQGVYDALFDAEPFMKLNSFLTDTLGVVKGLVKAAGGLGPILQAAFGTFLSAKAQQAPIFLQNMLDNFKIMAGFGQTKAQQTQSQMTQALLTKANQATNGADKMEFQQLAHVSAMREKILSVQHLLNSEQQRSVQLQLQQAQAAADTAVAKEKELDSERQRLAQSRMAVAAKEMEAGAQERIALINKQNQSHDRKAENLMRMSGDFAAKAEADAKRLENAKAEEAKAQANMVAARTQKTQMTEQGSYLAERQNLEKQLAEVAMRAQANKDFYNQNMAIAGKGDKSKFFTTTTGYRETKGGLQNTYNEQKAQTDAATKDLEARIQKLDADFQSLKTESEKQQEVKKAEDAYTKAKGSREQAEKALAADKKFEAKYADAAKKEAEKKQETSDTKALAEELQARKQLNAEINKYVEASGKLGQVSNAAAEIGAAYDGQKTSVSDLREQIKSLINSSDEAKQAFMALDAADQEVLDAPTKKATELLALLEKLGIKAGELNLDKLNEMESKVMGDTKVNMSEEQRREYVGAARKEAQERGNLPINPTPKTPLEIPIPTNLQVVTQTITAMAGAAMTANSAMNSLRNAMDIWSDEDATPFEKVGAALSLMTTTMMFFNSASKIGNAITAKRIALQKVQAASGTAVAAGEAAATAGVNANTGAVAANTAAWMSNPIGLIITIAVMALAAVFALATKRIEDNTKKLQENAEAAKQDADAISEEVSERQKLVQTYYDELSVYEQTKSNKEALADAAREVAEAYKLENAQMLIAQGNYEALNALVAEAAEKDRRSLMDAKIKEVETAMEAGNAKYDGEFDPQKYVGTYTRGNETDLPALATDEQIIISEEDSKALNRFLQVKNSIVTSLEQYEGIVADIGEVVVLGGEAYLQTTIDGMSYLVDAQGNIYDNAGKLINAQNVDKNLSDSTLKFFEDVGYTIDVSKGKVEAAGVTDALSSNVISFADSIVSLPGEGNEEAKAQIPVVRNAVALFANSLAEMAGSGFLGIFEKSNQKKVLGHAEKAQDYVAGYVGDVIPSGEDIKFGDYITGQDRTDSVFSSSSEMARHIAHEIINSNGETLADLEFFKNYDEEYLKTYFGDDFFDISDLKNNSVALMEFLGKYFNLDADDTLMKEILMEMGQVKNQGSLIPIMSKQGDDTGVRYDPASQLFFSSEGYSLGYDSAAMLEWVREKHGENSDEMATIEKLAELEGTNGSGGRQIFLNSSTAFGASGFLKSSPGDLYYNQAYGTYYRITEDGGIEPVLNPLGESAGVHTKERNEQVAAMMLGEKLAGNYVPLTTADGTVVTDSDFGNDSGPIEVVKINYAAADAYTGEDLKPSGENSEEPSSTIKIDKNPVDNKYYEVNEQGEFVGEPLTAGVDFTVSEGTTKAKTSLTGFEPTTVGGTGQSSTSVPYSAMAVEAYIGNNQGISGAQLYRNFMSETGNAMTLAQSNAWGKHFAENAGDINQFMLDDGTLDFILAGQYFNPEEMKDYGVLSSIQNRRLNAAAAAEGYEVVEDEETGGYLVKDAAGNVVYEAASVSQGIMMKGSLTEDEKEKAKETYGDRIKFTDEGIQFVPSGENGKMTIDDYTMVQEFMAANGLIDENKTLSENISEFLTMAEGATVYADAAKGSAIASALKGLNTSSGAADVFGVLTDKKIIGEDLAAVDDLVDGYDQRITDIIGEVFFSPEEVEEILASQGYAEQGKALRHVLENAQSDFQLDLLKAYDGLSADQKTVFFSIDFKFLTKDSEKTVDEQVNEVIGQITKINDAVQAEQYKINAEKAKESWGDVDTIEEMRDFETSSGIQWGAESGLSAESGYEKIITYSEFLAMSYEEQIAYINGLVDAYDKGYSDIVQSGINASKELRAIYEESRNNTLDAFFKKQGLDTTSDELDTIEEQLEYINSKYEYNAEQGKWFDRAAKVWVTNEDTISQLEAITSLTNSIDSETARIGSLEENLKLEVVLNRREYDAFVKETLGATITVGVVFEAKDVKHLEQILGDSLSQYGYFKPNGDFVVTTTDVQGMQQQVLGYELDERKRKQQVGDFKYDGKGSSDWSPYLSNSDNYTDNKLNDEGIPTSVLEYFDKIIQTNAEADISAEDTLTQLGLNNVVGLGDNGKTQFINGPDQTSLQTAMAAIMTYESGKSTDFLDLVTGGFINSYADARFAQEKGIEISYTPARDSQGRLVNPVDVIDNNFATQRGMDLASYRQGYRTMADSAEAGYMDVFGGATLDEQYQNRILTEEQLTAEGYDGAAIIQAILQSALNGDIKLNTSDDLNDAIAQEKETVGMYNRESAVSGIGIDELKEEVEYLEKYGELATEDKETIINLANAQLRLERATESMNENGKEWIKTLKEGNKKGKDWKEAVQGLEEVYKDVFDLEPGTEFSKAFIESAENAELLEKAINGDQEALDQLQANAMEDIIAEAKIKITTKDGEELTGANLSERINEIANNAAIEDLKIGATLDDATFKALLGDLQFNTYEAAAAMNAALGTVGLEGELIPYVVNPDGVVQEISEGQITYTTSGQGVLSSTFSTNASGSIQTYQEGTQVFWGFKNAKKTADPIKTSSPRGGRGGGGGGGGGGSRKPQAEKKQEPDKERYHSVTNQLEDLTDAYDKVSKAADRAFGKSRIKLLREQQDALKDLAATQQDYIDEINNYYKQDLSNLDQVSQYVGFDVQLDENGTITNFDAIQDAMWDEYNSHINDKGEVTDMDEEAWKEYEKEWNRIMELIATYEETQDKRKEALQQLQDYINEIYDLQLEEITYAVEVDIEASDDALKILDYMLSRIEDDAWAAAEAITYMGDKAATFLDQNNTYTSGIRDILMNHTQDIKDSNGKVLQKAQLSKADVEGFMAGDAEAIDKIMKLNDAFTEEEVENLRDYHNSLIEMNESLVELRESVFDKVLDSFEKFNEEMDKSIEKIDHLSAVTENYKNIIDIVGKKNLNISNALLDSLNQANVEQRINRVDATRTKRDTIAAEITRAEAALTDARSKGLEEDAKLWEKTLEEMRSSLDEAEEDFMQSWEDALDSIREQFEEAVGHAVETLSDALAGPLMGSMDQLQDAFDRQNTIAERYLPDYEKIYELNKLNRDITNSIDETDNIKAKQELAELQAEINALEESEAEISEYQMENLRRRYELKMAEIALTEAQDAKSQVQMSRDADGNWSYVYTANEDQVAEAEQNYEDRLFAIQQANAEYINAMQESMVQLEAEMAQKIEEIMLDETLSAEEKMAKLQEVTTFYQGQMEYYMDELELVLGENQVLYEQDWTKYSELTGYKISANEDYVDNFNETALSTLTGFETMQEFQQNFNDAIGHPDSHGLLYDLSQAYDTWANNTEAAMNAAGTSVSDFADDMAEDVDDILDASEEATEGIEEMGEKVKDTFDQLTDAVENWSQVYSAKIDEILQKNTALAESFHKILDAWSKYNEATTDDSTDAPSEEGEPTDDGEPADEGADVPDTVAEKTEKYKKGIAFAIWSHPSSGWGHGNSSKNLTSGDRYNRLKAKGLDPNTVQQQINAYRGKSTDYMKKDSGISFKKWSDRVGALNPYTYKKFAFDTGGYTGDWGEEGRWALLHSKEIVLNKDDTANLLSAVDMIRQISKAIDLNAYSSAGYGNSIIKAGIGEGGTLEQNVHITAEFPNATNREEIYSAFTDIINLASQYANRK